MSQEEEEEEEEELSRKIGQRDRRNIVYLIIKRDKQLLTADRLFSRASSTLAPFCVRHV